MTCSILNLVMGRLEIKNDNFFIMGIREFV
jgi:hypothetical protein